MAILVVKRRLWLVESHVSIYFSEGYTNKLGFVPSMHFWAKWKLGLKFNMWWRVQFESKTNCKHFIWRLHWLICTWVQTNFHNKTMHTKPCFRSWQGSKKIGNGPLLFVIRYDANHHEQGIQESRTLQKVRHTGAKKGDWKREWCISSVSDTGKIGKRKSEFSQQESNLQYDLLITSSGALPLSYRRLVGGKAIKLGSCDKHPAYC